MIFPYQGGPILVGLRLGGATLMDGLRVTLPIALITVVALLPLQFYWWRWLSNLPEGRADGSNQGWGCRGNTGGRTGLGTENTVWSVR